MKLNIVLLEPEIPHNTGAIGRTCSVTGCALHLIRPLGFSTDEKHLRRTGLDYWHSLNIVYHDSYPDFLEFFGLNSRGRLWMVETKGSMCYTDVSFAMDDYLMLGSESYGIPDKILCQNPGQILRIPMAGGVRSLNLSVAAGIIIYEALRQNGFSGLS